MSECPWARASWFHAVRPCRSRTSRRLSDASATRVRDVRRQRDRRAVAPEPLEGVEGALLLVLHVHDDLAVVEQDPPALALPLAPDRFGAGLAELVLDLVD